MGNYKPAFYAVRELYYSQYNHSDNTNFHSQLYSLFQKADPENWAKLAVGFPEEAAALSLWSRAGNNGDDLFREYGLLED